MHGVESFVREARQTPATQIHEAVLATFQLAGKNYRLNQLRYDLLKLKGHGLLERDGRRYAYRLTTKELDVALLFLFFHKRLCGPLANSRFYPKPQPQSRPNSNWKPPTTRPIRPSRTSLTC